MGDIDGKVGFAADRALIYATGGIAFTNYSFTQTVAPTASWGAGSRTGWMLGGGVDYAIDNNWIAGVSYKHFDFGSATSTGVLSTGVAAATVRFRETESTLMARIVYKFGSPANSPVVAKY